MRELPSRAQCRAEPTRWRSWCSRGKRAVRSPRCTSTTVSAPAPSATPRSSPRLRAPSGAAFRAVRAAGRSGSQPRSTGTCGPLRGAPARCAHRAHGRRPSRDRAAEPVAGRRPRWPRWHAPAQPSSVVAAPRGDASVVQRARAPTGAGRDERRPEVPSQPDPSRGDARARRHRRARRRQRSSRARPTCCATTRTCSISSRSTSTRPMPAPSATHPRPSLGARSAGGWPTATRLTPRRSSACSPSLGATPSRPRPATVAGSSVIGNASI